MNIRNLVDISAVSRRILAAALIASAAAATDASAQITFTLLGADARNYPTVEVTFDAKDRNGMHIGTFLPSDFTVVEDGVVRPVQNISCPQPVTPPLSLTIATDISYSMSIAGRMDNAKSAATELVRMLTYPPAQTGIVTFDDNTKIALDYTEDTSAIHTAIRNLKTNQGGGTDFVGAFLDANTGAIDFTRNRAGERYIIFLTDGNQTVLAADEQAIINGLRAAGIKLYSLLMTTGIYNLALRRIATASGGQWFESITTEQQAKDAFRQIGDMILEYPPCTFTYLTTGCETVRNLEVTLRKNNASSTRATQLTIDPAAIVTLEAAPSFVEFGVVPPGLTRTADITLTSRNGSTTVQSVSLPFYAFKVVSWGGSSPPFVLDKNQSRVIRIQYTSPDTSRNSCALAVQATAPCIQHAVVSAGALPIEPLRLVQPNGGEILYSGSNYTLKWAGVPTNRQVSLEYSTDAGSSWWMITPSAYSLSVPWTVPNTPSTTCLGLVYTREQRNTPKDILWLPLQPNSVNSLAFAPGGTLLAAGLADGRIKIHNPESGSLVDVLSKHNGGVNSVAFSPDSRYLASAGDDGIILIWETSTGALLRELRGHSGQVHSAVFSRQGEWLVSADQTSVVLWRTADWSQAWTRNGNSIAGGALAFAPDGNWIASSIGNQIAVLRASDGIRLRTLDGHGGSVRTMSVCGDGRLLASGGDDRTIRIWDTDKWETRTTLSGHGAGITSVQLAFSGLFAVSASRDRSVRVWDVRRAQVAHTFSGHTQDVLSAAADARIGLLASAGSDKSIRIWGYQIPLSDISDSLWSIITPTTTLETRGPAFDNLICPGEMSDSEILVRNIGNQPITIQNATFSGDGKDAFSFAPGTSIPPPMLLQPEDSSRIGVRFFAAVPGDYQAVLTLATDAPSLPLLDIPLIGHKDSARIAVGPDTVDIGELYSCTLPGEASLIAINTGTVDGTLDSAECSLAGQADILQDLPRDFLPGAVDTLAMLIRPSAYGDFSGFLAFRSQPCGAFDTIFVKGRYSPSTPAAYPSELLFGFTSVSDTSEQSVIIRNPTGTSMVLDAAETGDQQFTIISPAAFPVLIPPHDSILITLEFTPETEGEIRSQFIVRCVLPCPDSVSIPLSGISARKPAIAFHGGDFPRLLCADERFSDSAVILINTGGVPLLISGMTLGGAHPSDFGILSPTTAVIPPADSLEVLLRFQPVSTGIRTATLSIANNSPQLPNLIVSLSGVKDSAGFAIDPPSIDAGTLFHCDFPLRRTVVYRNTGTVPITAFAIPAAPAPFITIDSSRFPIWIAAGDSAVLEIKFNPIADGAYWTDLRFRAEPCELSAVLRLDAKYEPSGPRLPSGAYDFGTLAVTDMRREATSIMNPSSIPMNIAAIEIERPGMYLKRIEPASLPAVVPAGGSIPLVFEYSPQDFDTLQTVFRVIADSPCTDTALADLRGQARSALSSVALADLAAEVGERVRIPLILESSTDLPLVGARAFRSAIVFNRSMLWPETAHCSAGTASFITAPEGDSLVITIDASFASAPQTGPMAELECLVLLGNAEATVLNLRSFEWTSGTVAVSSRGGSFTVQGICREGGPRLTALYDSPMLLGNTPNPFNPSTEIAFSLPRDMHADLRVYDVLGRNPRILFSGPASKGRHNIMFSAEGLPAGPYLCVLEAGNVKRTMWMMMVK